MLPSWNFSSLATENESRLCLNWVGLFCTWVELLYCSLLLLSHFSCVQLCGTPWTVAHQAPLSMGFSRQEHWSGLLFPSPGDSSPPRIGTWVSCIGRQLLYQWATPWETDKLDSTRHLMLLGKSICLCQWLRASLVPFRATFGGCLRLPVRSSCWQMRMRRPRLVCSSALNTWVFFNKWLLLTGSQLPYLQSEVVGRKCLRPFLLRQPFVCLDRLGFGPPSTVWGLG